MAPITSISKTQTEYFGDKTVQEFWLKLPETAPPVNNNNNSMARLKTCIDSAPKDSVICVFSEELSCKILCEFLAKARYNGGRIYILTNNYNNEMNNLKGCLIRYGGGKRIGSFILVNPNSNMPSGCLFTGRLAEASVSLPENLLLDLDGNQIPVLFRYFCYQFWNKSEKERDGQGVNNEEHNAASAPLDIYPPVSDSCDFEYLKSEWGKEAENAQITASLLAESPYMKFTNFSRSNIVSLFSGINDNLVRSLKQKQNEIYAFDGGSLINSVKKADGNTWLIPKIDNAREEEVYALLLNSDQANILDKHIITVSQGKVQYRYFEKDTRENIKDKTIFNLGGSISQEYKINSETQAKPVLPPPTELLPKDKFEALKPDFIDDGRSVSIKYEWTIAPFTLPSKSDKHQLYQDWINAEKAINKYIENIIESILENEKGEHKFLKLIPRFLLTKKQKFGGYRNSLNMLKDIKYGGISGQELQEKIKEINEIRAAVEKDSGELMEEGRKAELLEQIEEKKKEKAELDAKLVEIQKLSRETDEAVKNQSEIYNNLEKQGDKIKEEIKDSNKKLNPLNTEKNKISNDIRSLNSQISKIIVNEKTPAEQVKNRERLEKELDEKQKALIKTEEDEKNQSDNLKKLEEQKEEKNKEIKTEKTKLDDLTVKQKKINGEKEGVEREINRCNNSINNLNEQLKSPAKEPQKKQSALTNLLGGGKKSSQSGQTGELPVPQLPQFPSVGDLYKNNGQDYLAITNWEDYDQGKAEAKRLNAKLCAKGGNNG